MEFFNQLIVSIQTNSDPLSFLGGLFSLIVTIYIFKKESSSSFIRERHDKLFFPLFDLLEPVLYKNVQPDLLRDAIKIIKDNKNIADGKLLEIFYLCSQNPSQQNFDKLCSYVDRMYDISCWRIGLKLRGLSYRIDREQFKHKITFLLLAVVCTLFALGMGMIITYSVLLGIAILYSILLTISSQTNPVFAFLFLCFVWLIIMKFLGKHS